MSVRRKRQTALGPSSVFGVGPISEVSFLWSNTTSSTLTSGAYSGAQPNDIILVICQHGGNNATLSASSAGLVFTKIISSGDGTWQSLAAFYAIAPDTTNRGITLNPGINTFLGMYIAVIRGVDTVNTINGTPAAASHAATSTPSTPSVTTINDNSWAFAAVSTISANSPIVSSAGWTNVLSLNSSGNSSLGVARKNITPPGATGVINFTHTAGGAVIGHNLTFALSPLQL